MGLNVRNPPPTPIADRWKPWAEWSLAKIRSATSQIVAVGKDGICAVGSSMASNGAIIADWGSKKVVKGALSSHKAAQAKIAESKGILRQYSVSPHLISLISNLKPVLFAAIKSGVKKSLVDQDNSWQITKFAVGSLDELIENVTEPALFTAFANLFEHAHSKLNKPKNEISFVNVCDVILDLMNEKISHIELRIDAYAQTMSESDLEIATQQEFAKFSDELFLILFRNGEDELPLAYGLKSYVFCKLKNVFANFALDQYREMKVSLQSNAHEQLASMPGGKKLVGYIHQGLAGLKKHILGNVSEHGTCLAKIFVQILQKTFKFDEDLEASYASWLSVQIKRDFNAQGMGLGNLYDLIGKQVENTLFHHLALLQANAPDQEKSVVNNLVDSLLTTYRTFMEEEKDEISATMVLREKHLEESNKNLREIFCRLSNKLLTMLQFDHPDKIQAPDKMKTTLYQMVVENFPDVLMNLYVEHENIQKDPEKVSQLLTKYIPLQVPSEELIKLQGSEKLEALTSKITSTLISNLKQNLLKPDGDLHFTINRALCDFGIGSLSREATNAMLRFLNDPNEKIVAATWEALTSCLESRVFATLVTIAVKNIDASVDKEAINNLIVSSFGIADDFYVTYLPTYVEHVDETEKMKLKLLLEMRVEVLKALKYKDEMAEEEIKARNIYMDHLLELVSAKTTNDFEEHIDYLSENALILFGQPDNLEPEHVEAIIKNFRLVLNRIMIGEFNQLKRESLLGLFHSSINEENAKRMVCVLEQIAGCSQGIETFNNSSKERHNFIFKDLINQMFGAIELETLVIPDISKETLDSFRKTLKEKILPQFLYDRFLDAKSQIPKPLQKLDASTVLGKEGITKICDLASTHVPDIAKNMNIIEAFVPEILNEDKEAVAICIQEQLKDPQKHPFVQKTLEFAGSYVNDIIGNVILNGAGDVLPECKSALGAITDKIVDLLRGFSQHNQKNIDAKIAVLKHEGKVPEKDAELLKYFEPVVNELINIFNLGKAGTLGFSPEMTQKIIKMVERQGPELLITYYDRYLYQSVNFADLVIDLIKLPAIPLHDKERLLRDHPGYLDIVRTAQVLSSNVVPALMNYIEEDSKKIVNLIQVGLQTNGYGGISSDIIEQVLKTLVDRSNPCSEKLREHLKSYVTSVFEFLLLNFSLENEDDKLEVSLPNAFQQMATFLTGFFANEEQGISEQVAAITEEVDDIKNQIIKSFANVLIPKKMDADSKFKIMKLSEAGYKLINPEITDNFDEVLNKFSTYATDIAALNSEDEIDKKVISGQFKQLIFDFLLENKVLDETAFTDRLKNDYLLKLYKIFTERTQSFKGSNAILKDKLKSLFGPFSKDFLEKSALKVALEDSIPFGLSKIIVDKIHDQVFPTLIYTFYRDIAKPTSIDRMKGFEDMLGIDLYNPYDIEKKFKDKENSENINQAHIMAKLIPGDDEHNAELLELAGTKEIVDQIKNLCSVYAGQVKSFLQEYLVDESPEVIEKINEFLVHAKFDEKTKKGLADALRVLFNKQNIDTKPILDYIGILIERSMFKIITNLVISSPQEIHKNPEVNSKVNVLASITARFLDKFMTHSEEIHEGFDEMLEESNGFLQKVAENAGLFDHLFTNPHKKNPAIKLRKCIKNVTVAINWMNNPFVKISKEERMNSIIYRSLKAAFFKETLNTPDRTQLNQIISLVNHEFSQIVTNLVDNKIQLSADDVAHLVMTAGASPDVAKFLASVYECLVKTPDEDSVRKNHEKIFKEISKEIILEAFPNFKSELPAPDAFKSSLANGIQNKIFPQIIANSYYDINKNVLQTPDYKDQLQRMYKGSKVPEKAIKELSALVKDFIPIDVIQNKKDYAKNIHEQAVEQIKAPKNDHTEELLSLVNFLKDPKNAIPELLEGNIEKIMHSDNPKVQEFWNVVKKLVNGSLLKVFSGFSERIFSFENPKSPNYDHNFLIDLSLSMLNMTTSHFSKINETVVDKKKDYVHEVSQEDLLRGLNGLRHPGVGLEGDLDKQALDNFYVPFTQKLLELSGIKMGSDLFPQPFDDKLFDVCQNKLIPAVVKVIYEKMLSKEMLDLMMLNSLEMFNDVAKSVTIKKIPTPDYEKFFKSKCKNFLNHLTTLRGPMVVSEEAKKAVGKKFSSTCLEVIHLQITEDQRNSIKEVASGAMRLFRADDEAQKESELTGLSKIIINHALENKKMSDDCRKSVESSYKVWIKKALQNLPADKSLLDRLHFNLGNQVKRETDETVFKQMVEALNVVKNSWLSFSDPEGKMTNEDILDSVSNALLEGTNSRIKEEEKLKLDKFENDILNGEETKSVNFSNHYIQYMKNVVIQLGISSRILDETKGKEKIEILGEDFSYSLVEVTRNSLANDESVLNKILTIDNELTLKRLAKDLLTGETHEVIHQTKTNRHCGKMVKAFIDLVPDDVTKWLYNSFESIRSTPAEAIGRALRVNLKEKSLLDFITDGLKIGIPAVKDARSKLGRRIKQEDYSQKLLKTLSTTVTEHVRKFISDFFTGYWNSLQEKLNQLILRYLGQVGAKVKTYLDQVFHAIFFDVVGTILKIILYPLDRLFYGFVYWRARNRSQHIIKDLHHGIGKSLAFNLSDEFLKKLEINGH